MSKRPTRGMLDRIAQPKAMQFHDAEFGFDKWLETLG
jgi:hypothetical protein